MRLTADRRTLLWLLTAVVAAVALGLAAFLVLSDGDGAGPDDPAAPDEPSVLPLLGTRGQVPDRPALGVKIDTTEAGRPQTGLVEADVVFEEQVEGGLTRLLAVYHSQDPETVGPVRSARSTDIVLLGELARPQFAWSGANPTFRAAVEAADLIDVGFLSAPDAYERDDAGRAPYNLYASTGELRSVGEDSDPEAGPPPALFDYRAEGAPLDDPAAEPTATYQVPESAGLATSIRWDWDEASATWRRTQNGTPHVDVEGTAVSAANVVVRVTPYRDSGVRDSTGAVVPEAVTVGEGDVLVLTDGQMLAGRWRKPSEDEPTTYTGPDGAPLLLTPGQTWVEVVPAGG